MVEAIASGTGKIVNSVLDKGASFAIDLNARVGVRILEDEHGIMGNVNVTPIIKNIAENTLNLFGYDYGLEIEVESEIPSSVGLGDSEAISTATIMAVAGALAKKHGSVNELRIDKYMSEQFLIIDDKVVDKKRLIDLCTDLSMEFDRTCASFYGGFVISDNKKREILRRGEMESLHAVILIPKEKMRIDLDEIKLFQNEIEIMWDEALKGNLYSAMKLNTLIYGDKIAREMLKKGSLSVTVSFPSIIALVRDERKVGDVGNSVKREGAVLTRKMNNEGARVMVKPKKIVKIKEFLKLKGDEEFHLL
ncbi:MAG: hypothetical protein DRO76_03445 [Candidatus Altiarchaeales archaeon]|nr:MAG: hypothetical protein DRO76_03445 [Candidatus Altiarchaeales archaeon]